MTESNELIPVPRALIDRLQNWAAAHVNQLPDDDWGRGYQYAAVRVNAELEVLLSQPPTDAVLALIQKGTDR